MTYAAIIVAAGRGQRAGGELPKQWQNLVGQRVIDWTLQAFAAVPEIARTVVVVHPDDKARIADVPSVTVVEGGETRAASVLNGLSALEGQGITHVLIHDAARCCLTPDLIQRVLEALIENADDDGVAPALPVTDALWQGTDNRVTGTADRAGLYRAQTPQGFGFDTILAAHRHAATRADAQPADDVEVARAFGLDVRIVPGVESNLKITTPADFERAAKIVRGPMDIRTGSGFDVHRFCPGDHVMLCGVAIPHTRGLKGHSDADVALHTVTDALYGAMAEGDIGRHFPPSDPQWKGAESHIFLRHAVDLAMRRGFRISNVDLTLICEHPKIGPHAESMIENLAEIMELPLDRVSVKATTSERLGFTGREEGIAAQAVVTVMST